jgi:hypothetical protein
MSGMQIIAKSPENSEAKEAEVISLPFAYLGGVQFVFIAHR